ncbi:MAG: glycoside hydrolase family 16 protein [Acidimicrobiia bacterium]|nr:glycoside hydrolase family 16 protein [Acidimicrobiia bacterium]
MIKARPRLRVAMMLSLLLTLGACGSSTTATTIAASTTTTVPPTTTTTIATPEPIPVDPPDGMELAWSDEFDGETIDTTNWTYDIGGWGWGNGEAQYYTDRSENARVQNGLLVIEAAKEQFEASYYTSARLLTQGLREFQYGYIEARIKVPDGKGTWPAFWMLGANFGRDTENPDDSNWPDVGEIDIMEYAGKEPDLVLGTIHGPGYAGAGGLTTWNRQEFSIAEDFHTFAIDWDFDGIRWYFDGELYAEKSRDSVGNREWVFDQPFFIILNLALGGTIGGLIPPDADFPQYLYVDYVRVYQPVDG